MTMKGQPGGWQAAERKEASLLFLPRPLDVETVSGQDLLVHVAKLAAGQVDVEARNRHDDVEDAEVVAVGYIGLGDRPRLD